MILTGPYGNLVHPKNSLRRATKRCVLNNSFSLYLRFLDKKKMNVPSFVRSFISSAFLSLRCKFCRTPGSTFFNNLISTYLKSFAPDCYSLFLPFSSNFSFISLFNLTNYLINYRNLILIYLIIYLHCIVLYYSLRSIFS